MIKRKIVTAQDAAIRKILNDPRHEIAGDVSYKTADGLYNTYSPKIKRVTGDDSGIQEIMSDPKHEIAGNVSYKKDGITYQYQQPEAPSYTKPQGASPDYAAQLEALAAMGNWGDDFNNTVNERLKKIAQSGGQDGGVSTAELVNQLKQKYSKSYNDYQQKEEINRLLTGNVSTPYDDLYQELLKRYNDYSYDDFIKGNQYGALKGMYDANGQNAMKDVLGEVSSRTGGLASSYATATAQEQYNNYMQQLAAAAQNMYQNERGNLRDYLGLIGNRMDTESANRRSGNMNIYNALMQIRDQEREDAVREQSWAREDKMRAEDRQYDRDQIARNEARNAIASALTDPDGSHMIEDIDPELIAMSGMSWAEMVALANAGRQAADDRAFNREVAEKELEMNEYNTYNRSSGRSSGSGGRRRSSGGGGSKQAESAGYDYDTVMAELEYDIADGKSKEEIVSTVEALFDGGYISEDVMDQLLAEIENRFSVNADTHMIFDIRKW